MKATQEWSYFRDQLIAAQLKVDKRGRARLNHMHFRDQLIAAQLKARLRSREHGQYCHFRDQLIAAQLKAPIRQPRRPPPRHSALSQSRPTCRTMRYVRYLADFAISAIS